MVYYRTLGRKPRHARVADVLKEALVEQANGRLEADVTGGKQRLVSALSNMEIDLDAVASQVIAALPEAKES